MRLKLVLSAAATLVAANALAHGPQIQTTLENGKIVTRRIIGDGPYSTLTQPTSVYVMPLALNGGVWYTRPNGALLPGGLPEFNSGPGLAYGCGYDAATNPQPFPVGSQFSLFLAPGLARWNGSQFIGTGSTELEAFRGSGANLVVARTTPSGPFPDIKFPSVISPAAGISFAADGAETHTSVSFRMLGDGVTTTSALPDGIYLLRLVLGSTNSGILPSQPYYFVLPKGAAAADVNAAVQSLGFHGALVQNLTVPEPGSLALAAPVLMGSLRRRRRLASQAEN